MADLTLKNFNLSLFKSLIDESMIVNNQIVMSLSDKEVKCCAMSTDKTLMKMWSIELSKLLDVETAKPSKLSKLPTVEEIAEFDNIFASNVEDLGQPTVTETEMFPEAVVEQPKKETPKFDEFDLFILRCEHFKKFLDVHSTENVTIDFNFQVSNDTRKRAAELIINSTIGGDGNLSTKYILSTDEMITVNINDLQKTIEKLEPTDKMYSVVLGASQIQTIRNMIKSLHKANPMNVPYLNFVIDPQKFIVTISDTVFNLDYKLASTNVKNLPKTAQEFSIFKSDFASLGNHDFTIYVDENSSNLALFLNPVVKCIVTFLPEQQKKDAAIDNSINNVDDINIDDYFS
jgi:hypothetical protein